MIPTGEETRMSLHIFRRDKQGIEILALTGRLVFGPGDLRLQEELDRIVKAGKDCVVLNLNKVSEIDDAGFSTLIFASAKLRKAGGGLVLVNLRPSHIADLVASRPVLASELFKEVFKEEQDAIDSFFPGRRIQGYDILEYIRTAHQSGS